MNTSATSTVTPVGERQPPGPKGAWLVGSAPRFRKDMPGFIEACRDEFGDIVQYRLGPIRICQITDPDMIREVLVDQHDKVIKPWGIRQLRHALGDGLITAEGDDWRRQRQRTQPAFHMKRLNLYAQVMCRCGAELADAWRDGEQRDLFADMMGLTLGVVGECLLGMDFEGGLREDVAAAQHRFMGRFEKTLASAFPLPMSFPSPGNLLAHRSVRRLRRAFAEAIDKRRQGGPDGHGGDDLLSWMLEAQQDWGMSDERLIDEVLTLITAGHETTAATLMMAMVCLARHPEADRLMQAELAAVLGDGPPGPEHASQLPYTKQVIQETMRLYPASWGLAREVVTPFQLAGYTMDKGVNILIPQYNIQRDARFFPEPDAFRPERFAPDRDNPPPKYAYFPFGGGPRFCIGSQFATMEATLVLASLMQRYRIALRDAEVPMQFSVTLRPRDALPVTVRAR